MKAFLLLALLAFRCVETPMPPPSPPGIDAGSAKSSCAEACNHLRSIGCPEGSPDGDTCEAICENAETSGLGSVNPTCLSKITTCDQIDGC
jgi:hypothetical protein